MVNTSQSLHFEYLASEEEEEEVVVVPVDLFNLELTLNSISAESSSNSLLRLVSESLRKFHIILVESNLPMNLFWPCHYLEDLKLQKNQVLMTKVMPYF